jgi:hypothetical protein
MRPIVATRQTLAIGARRPPCNRVVEPIKRRGRIIGAFAAPFHPRARIVFLLARVPSREERG